jgi:hypothetical protein
MLITDETFLQASRMADDRYACLLHSTGGLANVCDDHTEKIGVHWPRGRCTVTVRLWLEIHSFAQLELSTLPRVAFEGAVEFP